MASFYLPYINPIKYYQLGFTPADQYVSKHMDDFSFEDSILPWQQQTKFYQHWQTSDTISEQVISSASPINLKVYDSTGNLCYEDNFDSKGSTNYITDGNIYEHSLPLSDFDEGIYFRQLTIGSLTLMSEPLIIKEKIEGSLLVEYTNFKYFGGVIFETDFSPSISIPGTLSFDKPGSKKTIYEDQILNSTVLDSKPFRVYKLHIGTSEGIPDYLIDKLNFILGCSTLSIDGRLYTTPEGAQFEKSSEENYPMNGWTIELRDKLNRSARAFDDIEEITIGDYVMTVIDTKGFGLNTSGETIVIDVN